MTGKLELDDKGNIKASSLVGYDVYLLGGVAALLRLRLAATEEELKSGTLQQVDIALTAVQCRLLAEELLQLEATLLDQKPDRQHS